MRSARPNSAPSPANPASVRRVRRSYWRQSVQRIIHGRKVVPQPRNDTAKRISDAEQCLKRHYHGRSRHQAPQAGNDGGIMTNLKRRRSMWLPRTVLRMIINGAESISRGIRQTAPPLSRFPEAEARKVFAEQAIAVGRHAGDGKALGRHEKRFHRLRRNRQHQGFEHRPFRFSQAHCRARSAPLRLD